MRVLVVAEGKHERGGALENLLKRLAGDTATFEFDRVANKEIHTFHGKGQGYFKRAVRWLLEAEKRRVDALVFLIDEDGQRERVAQIGDAQNSSMLQLSRAMGVAIRTFDAWMLADEGTLTRVLGSQIGRQRDPENIRDPKTVCVGLLADSSAPMAQTEMYARVANQADITVLSARCPSGFAPFAARVGRVFGYGRWAAEVRPKQNASVASDAGYRKRRFLCFVDVCW